MLIDMATLMDRYKPDITGILHVGAHMAEEYEDYSLAGVEKVVWVEANIDLVKKLEEERLPSHQTVVHAVVGDTNGEQVTFNISNNGQSSSVLELGTHKTAHPEVHYVDSRKMKTSRLDTIYATMEISGLNFMNLDIQGAELLALKGLGKRLDEFDYIYSEVNREELYVDCCLVDELDEFLSDFDRVETEWTSFGWGDAFYVRR